MPRWGLLMGAVSCGLAMVGHGAASRADEPVSERAGETLLAAYRCQSCHRPYAAGRGPSLHAIAEKYSSDPHARDVLESRVLNGSIGAWGDVPMPPYAVPERDLRPLVEWILAHRDKPLGNRP